MNEEDEGRKLRSGRVVNTMSESEGEQIEKNVEELHARVHELEQKLAMSEQAVDDKDEELQAVRAALENAKSEAATDVKLAREEERRKRNELEREFREAIKRLELQNQGLQESLDECGVELKNQEIKFELNRLQGLENVRQGFDREREAHLERIQKLEKELATEKELRSSTLTTGVSAVPGSETGGAPSHGADGGELSSASVEKPVGGRASASEHVVPSKVLTTDLLSGHSCKISDSEGGAPASVGTSVAAKVHESVVCETAPVEATSSSSGVTSPAATSMHEVLATSPGDSVSGVTGNSSKLATTESVVATPSKPEVVSGANSELVQSMTKFMQVQTDMMAAQAKAMAAQNLPPLVHFSGEGSLVGDESFDRWLEHFEELAAVAGWSEEHKKYRLKMHLSKTAFQTYCMLSKESKQSYSTAVEALRKRFHPVDIEELRGAEFYQICQKDESVEELGIKLQAAARKAFPSLLGKEHDRLMKGRFFQSLLPKWQRKLGAPKTEETFEDLFNRARTAEKHDQQYSQSAADKNDSRKKSNPNKTDKADGKIVRVDLRKSLHPKVR